MKRIYLIFAGFLLAISYKPASASTMPPVDFMTLEVCLRYSESPCTLREFIDNSFKTKPTESWEKTDGGQWMVTLTTLDQATKQKGKVVFVFAKEETGGKGFAVITRMVMNDGQAVMANNGQVYETADKEVSQGMLPSVVVPLIQAVNEKTGRAAQARSKNKEKAAVNERRELKKDLQAIPGDYYSDSEHIEIVKVSDDTVKAKISVTSKTYNDQILKLKYSREDGRYTSTLKVDKCNLLVRFGPGQMDSIQGIEFKDADGIPKPRRRGHKGDGCGISGRFVKRDAGA